LRFVVDTSALVAIVNDEPEAERFHGLLLDHDPLISCGTLIETLRVMQVGLGRVSLGAIDRLIDLYGIAPVPVDAEQVEFARVGMLAYGKGRGEAPASLNFGDLFAYALARQLRLPLLFKGDDFAATDILPLPEIPA
jgi:ribonuclease VapC